MKVFVILIAIFSFTCTIVQAAEGLINKTSSYNVQKTMDRFEKIVKDKDFNVIARQPHCGSKKIRLYSSTYRITHLW